MIYSCLHVDLHVLVHDCTAKFWLISSMSCLVNRFKGWTSCENCTDNKAVFPESPPHSKFNTYTEVNTMLSAKIRKKVTATSVVFFNIVFFTRLHEDQEVTATFSWISLASAVSSDFQRHRAKKQSSSPEGTTNTM